MVHNPGTGIHAVISRTFAPLPERLAAAVQRVAGIPDYLRDARRRLGDVSAVHAHTALDQLGGAERLVTDALPELITPFPDLAARLEPLAAAALDALNAYRADIADRADRAGRDPRIGPELFARKLALVLDTDFRPDALLAQALRDLEETAAEILAAAGQLAGTARPDPATVRAVLDDLGRDAPTDDTVLRVCRDALTDATAFVRDRGLVTVH